MKKRRVGLTDEEAWRIFELLEELHGFLHQPEKYEDQERVVRWLNGGVYAELRHVFYDIAAPWFPPDEATSEVNPPPGVKRRFSGR